MKPEIKKLLIQSSTKRMLCAGVWAGRVPGSISKLFPSKVVNW